MPTKEIRVVLTEPTHDDWKAVKERQGKSWREILKDGIEANE